MFFVALKGHTKFMKISKFILFILLNICFQQHSDAQGKLIYLNGKEKRFTSAEVKGQFIVYKPESTGSNKSTIRKADKYNIFSIKKDDGTEEIIYSPDTTYGDDLTIEEVRDYIKGEKYAKLAYKEPANFVTGIQVGFVSGMLLPAFYGLAGPVVYPGILGTVAPKVKTPLIYQYDSVKGDFIALPSGILEGEKVVSDAFSAGYGKKARNLKMRNSLLGGAIGFSFGVTALLLLADK